MAQRKRRPSKRMNDQEILERIIQMTRPLPLPAPQLVREMQKRYWQGALVGTFLWGPFMVLIAVMGWPERLLGTRWNVLIFLGVNALFSLLPSLLYHPPSEEQLASMPPEEQERWIAYSGFCSFMFLSWCAFFGSTMMLLCAIGGTMLRFPEFPWGVVLGICLALGAGFWWQRMAILRAIVEGPEAHPWFWPVLLFFAILSTGGFGAIFRVFTEVANLAVRNLGDIFAIGLIAGGYALFIGLTVVAISIACLHYQKWRGGKELRP